MKEKPLDVDDLLELCDSPFERDVFKRLTTLGYHVTPQVQVGVYSIDLVVEGAEDKRLAIELDGDQYHTPERWADDLARQRALERVGWRFWRCWGSSYFLDPEGCIDDLVGTLNDMGIMPLGSKVKTSNYTEHRTIDLPGLEAAENRKPIPFATELTEAVPSTAESVKEDEQIVQPGDRVLISYNDEPDRQYTLVLSEEQHDPNNLVINVSKPLAQALLGHAEEDEVEIDDGTTKRMATLLRVEHLGLSALH